jgi:hypothetical protein
MKACWIGMSPELHIDFLFVATFRARKRGLGSCNLYTSFLSGCDARCSVQLQYSRLMLPACLLLQVATTGRSAREGRRGRNNRHQALWIGSYYPAGQNVLL